jgi:uridine phosphorylase
MSVIALTCLQIPSSPIKYALTAVVVSALLIYMTRLDTFYDQSEMLRGFGTAPEETVFPAWMAMFAAGYAVYMMSAAIATLDAR